MERKDQNGKQYLRGVSIIFYGIMGGMAMFLAAILFITTTPEQENRSENPQVYYALLGGLFLIAFLVRRFWKPRRLETIRAMGTIKEKLNNYRSLLVIQMATAEIIFMFSSIFYMLTHQVFFVGISAGIIATYLLLRPSKDNLIDELDLSDDEIILFEDEAAAVADVRNNR